ncbi:PPE family protein [Mycobacterium hubeiense]|uniref:PPE family protein n=1 Tax=Mycobacterium hubeiense TaxID=1867256 RepID=UPI000C7F30F1|nr:PPE family protein [Mycobacterium sp. QGD 101]
MPPEVNTARLMAGAGPAPMLQAAAGWEAFAILLETQADELAASLANLSALWTGTAGERAVAATMPMVAWLRVASAQAQQRAAAATAQAEAYSTALATTPPLAEIELNHITHAVLEATNFLGINTIPIGLNEADYVRMWLQAAGVMHTYQFATAAICAVLEPIMKPKPVVIPGAEGAAMASMGQIAAMAPGSAFREAAFAHVSSQAAVESAALQGGRAAALGNHAATRAEGAVQKAENVAQQAGRQQDKAQPAEQGMQQGMQMGMQVASQVGSMVGQLPQQATQMVQGPMQTLTQPLQQVSSLFSQMGGDNGSAQIGLIGASPFSNHPLAGGSGAASGAGLVRAASLPGAGGTSPRTPLMENLVGKQTDVAPVAVAAGAAAGATIGGAAPVGAGGAGMGPMGMMGQNSKSGGSKAGLTAPRPLAQDLGEDDEDDW